MKASAALAVIVITSGVAFGGVGQNTARARKSVSSLPKLTSIIPSRELQTAMKPYGFKAFRCTDGTNAFQCLAYAPKANSSKGLPLVVYIPGNGERGDLVNQFRQPSLFNQVLSRGFQEKHPCHLLAISPPESLGTLLGGMPGKPNAVQRLMHDMILALAHQAKPKVDTKRIYVTGFSYGGDGAYAMALHYPSEFAAAIPVAAIPPTEMFFDKRHPGNLWDVYNEGDALASSRSNLARKRFRELTNAAGGDFRMSTYPAIGHDAWDKAWREDEIWDWMFSKSLGGAIASKSSGSVRVSFANAKCTATVAGRDTASGPERALDGLDETAYVPVQGFRKTDWWQVEFAQPVSGRVCLYSGNKDGADRLRNAVAEISSNGRTWRRMGTFSNKDGTCSFTSQQRFSHLRVRLIGDLQQNFMLRKMTVLASAR